jgi:hypothetical protein
MGWLLKHKCKLAAKISIAKETTNITQEVNMNRATKGVPLGDILILDVYI